MIGKDSVVFVASDALSHYILMMYELSKCNEYYEELTEERNAQSGNSQLLMTAETMKIDFRNDVIQPLLNATVSEEAFAEYVKGLYAKGVLDIDDYSLVVLQIPDTSF